MMGSMLNWIGIPTVLRFVPFVTKVIIARVSWQMGGRTGRGGREGGGGGGGGGGHR